MTNEISSEDPSTEPHSVVPVFAVHYAYFTPTPFAIGMTDWFSIVQMTSSSELENRALRFIFVF